MAIFAIPALSVPWISPQLALLTERLDVVPPPVVSHPNAPGPLLLGVWRPVIVLPDPLPAPADLRLIFANELDSDFGGVYFGNGD